MQMSLLDSELLCSPLVARRSLRWGSSPCGRSGRFDLSAGSSVAEAGASADVMHYDDRDLSGGRVIGSGGGLGAGPREVEGKLLAGAVPRRPGDGLSLHRRDHRSGPRLR